MKRGMFQLKVPQLDLGIFLVHPPTCHHFFRFRGLNGFGVGGGGGCGSCMEGSTSFQWCASISAIYLLILNRIGRRSATQTTLLVFYLFIAFPSALFKILRGQFGCWVAFLAILANLFFPQTFPFSRFTLFIITPNTVANGLRDDIAGGIFCLIIGIITFVIEIWETGGIASCRYSGHCFGYYFGIALLLLFAILYVCLGNW